MEISYTDLAGILQTIRENGKFDRVDDIYDFMDKLDEQEGLGIQAVVSKNTLVFNIDREMEGGSAVTDREKLKGQIVTLFSQYLDKEILPASVGRVLLYELVSFINQLDEPMFAEE